MNILGEQIFVHLILHIYNRIKRNNICPPRPHIDQYIWTRIFVHILKKNLLGKKTFVHLVLALVGHVLAMVEAAIDRGAAVKEVAEKHDYRDHDHHVHP